MKHFLLLTVFTFTCITVFGQDIYYGRLLTLPNPCTETPCLPGSLLCVKINSDDCVISIDSHWVAENVVVIDNNSYSAGDSVKIVGIISAKEDVLSNIFFEIVIESIEKIETSDIKSVHQKRSFSIRQSKESIDISFDTPTNGKILLSNLLGNILVTRRITGERNASIFINKLYAGVYILQFEDVAGISEGKKVIISAH